MFILVDGSVQILDGEFATENGCVFFSFSHHVWKPSLSERKLKSLYNSLMWSEPAARQTGDSKRKH